MPEPLISDQLEISELLNTLPNQPGIYCMLDKNENTLYVGKAKNLKKRVASYFQKNHSNVRIAHMLSQLADIKTTVTQSEAEALLLENNLIKSLAPRYNILFRDDKSYPYIALTRKNFPQLTFFRGNTNNKKADYYGPYPSGHAVRESIHLLQKTFQLRTCEESVFANRSRPCLLYQIKRCSAPCTNQISTEEYKKEVKLAKLFLNGQQQEVITQISHSMESASEALAFEKAARYRDQIVSLQAILSKQYVDNESTENMDIIVALQDDIAEGQSVSCINLAMVRGGRHLGDRIQFPSHAANADLNEILDAFLHQHYMTYPIPLKILLEPSPNPIISKEYQETLSELAEHPVTLLNTQNLRSARHKAWLQMALENATLAILSKMQTNENQSIRLEALKTLLDLPEIPKKIECFDISHTQGEATVAACVVYQDSGMKKAFYRRYNISNIQPGDDYAAMKQAISKRYAPLSETGSLKEQELSNPSKILPDLLLIDGGKGQVSQAHKILSALGIHLCVVGIVKGEGRKPMLDGLIMPDGKTHAKPGGRHPALHLIQEIRDEAHRFAITGHRARRSKARKTSKLDQIPGIGAARRKRLITHFGGIHGVLGATIKELGQVSGISHDIACTIHEYLHN